MFNYQFQCGNLPRKGQPRGKIQLDATRQLPRVFQAHANCWQLRRLGKAYRRAIEVCKAQPSPRLLRAWRNLSEALQACPSQWRKEIAAVLRRPPSIANAEAVAQILQKAMDFVQAEQRQHRLKLWKQQMRSSATKASAWRKLRQATKEKPILQHQKHYACIAVKAGSSHDGVGHSIWTALLAQRVLQEYGPVMRREQLDLQPISEHDLLQTVRQLTPSAPGLDGWRPQDLRLLGRICPSIFRHLASLINACETASLWPTSWTTGYVAMIPKTLSSEGHLDDPMDTRPITVLSALCRCWSRTRCRHVKPWILRVLPEEVCVLFALAKRQTTWP